MNYISHYFCKESILPTVLHAIEGFNCTIFTYGQTGSGKTHTMEGKLSDPELQGIIPRSVKTIFDSLKDTCSYRIRISHMEIYNEELTDLLAASNLRFSNIQYSTQSSTSSKSLIKSAHKRGIDMRYIRTNHSKCNNKPEEIFLGVNESEYTGPKRKLQIVNDGSTGLYVDGLEEIEVKSAIEIMRLLENSIQCRQKAATLCNKVRLY